MNEHLNSLIFVNCYIKMYDQFIGNNTVKIGSYQLESNLVVMHKLWYLYGHGSYSVTYQCCFLPRTSVPCMAKCIDTCVRSPRIYIPYSTPRTINSSNECHYHVTASEPTCCRNIVKQDEVGERITLVLASGSF